MNDLKLYRKLYGSGKDREKIDTVIANQKRNRIGYNPQIVEEARNCWLSMDKFRRNTDRNYMFTYGNQWGDKIQNIKEGGYITEEQHIRNQGKTPLKNNLIASSISAVMGQYEGNQTEPVCVALDRDDQDLGEQMTNAIQSNYNTQKLAELDSINLLYFLIGGLAVFKTRYSWIPEMQCSDVVHDIVNYHNFFMDGDAEDPRMTDITMIGQIYDMSLEDVLENFAGNDVNKAMELKYIYGGLSESSSQYYDTFDGDSKKHISFDMCHDMNKCRVIEVWRKETKEMLKCTDTNSGEIYRTKIENEIDIIRENKKRIAEWTAQGIPEEEFQLITYEWFIHRFWYCRYMAPDGRILTELECPYETNTHPYSVRAYPFVNKEIHSFVEVLIDQQKYINRLITMQDFIMGAAAKGVLMFPEECKPDEMSMEEISDAWSTYNGIIYYKAKAGVNAPKQIIANTSQAGVYELLNVQLQMFQDVSGIHGALQGKESNAGTPASKYALESQNAASSLSYLFKVYRSLRKDRDYKTMILQQQYYTEKRYLYINGKSTTKEDVFEYEPDKLNNVKFSINISESSSTSAYREVVNITLMDLFHAGAINVRSMLEVGSFPFADKLLQSIDKYEKEAQEGKTDDDSQFQVPDDIMKQIQNKGEQSQ